MSMSESGIISLFSVVLGISLLSNGAMWFRLGELTKAIKNACPFGGCPFFKRAKDEAAPERPSEGENS